MAPTSADLLAYRTAFHLGRPYWSGPRKARQYHLHQFDAASALLAATRAPNTGTIFYATDGHAISFTQLMDAFAHRVGRRTPLHLPSCSKLLARVIIREEHMQQTALPCHPGRRRRAWRDGGRSFRTIWMGSIRSSEPGATDVTSGALRWCRFVYHHKPIATLIRSLIRCRPSFRACVRCRTERRRLIVYSPNVPVISFSPDCKCRVQALGSRSRPGAFFRLPNR